MVVVGAKWSGSELETVEKECKHRRGNEGETRATVHGRRTHLVVPFKPESTYILVETCRLHHHFFSGEFTSITPFGSTPTPSSSIPNH